MKKLDKFDQKGRIGNKREKLILLKRCEFILHPQQSKKNNQYNLQKGIIFLLM